jgi:putative MFS transporter
LLAASFGLTIAGAVQAGTAFFLGMLLGTWGFGRLADRIGRRQVLIVTVLVDAVLGLASAFSTSFAMPLALRLLTGIGVGGTLPVDYDDGRVPAARAPQQAPQRPTSSTTRKRASPLIIRA